MPFVLSLSKNEHNKVSLTRLIECGFSYPRTRYFLLLRQKKVSKEKAARCRLLPALRRFYWSLPERTSLSFWQSAASMPHPLRAIPNKNASARRGITGKG